MKKSVGWTERAGEGEAARVPSKPTLSEPAGGREGADGDAGGGDPVRHLPHGTTSLERASGDV